MGAIRVTQGMIVQRTLNNLDRQMRRLFNVQDQLATGYRVNKPSDDPIAVRRAVNTRALIGKNEQYLANIQYVTPHMTETASTIQTALDVVQRAKEVTLQGASGTNGQTQLDAIANEINQILEQQLAHANHQADGRYIFGGTRTLNQPYVATRDADGDITAVQYQGNQQYARAAIADGIKVPVNEPGAEVFQSDQDLFQTLIDVRDALRGGDQTALQNNHLSELDTVRDQMLVALARVGAVQNRLEHATANIEDFNVQLQELLSDTIDADYADTIVNLNVQSNAFQAALNAGSRVIQPSLLDFVR